jgi:hypothetical protein
MIEDKTEGRHFDTTEVIDAESQATLISLRELLRCIYKVAESPGTVHTGGRGLFQG